MRHYVAFSFFFSFRLLGVPSFGQLTSGSISGRVTDASGLAIQGAAVTATSTTNGTVQRATTDSQGDYVISGIDPGAYQLHISKDGFQSWDQRSLTVTVGERATVATSLDVGSVAQSVEVEGSANTVEVQSSTVSTPIDTHTTQELPLNGRNVLQLMQLAPDTGPTSSAVYQQNASRPDQANNFVGSSGGRGDSTSYYLDGALNEDALTQIANVYPDPDAIQEFSFDTSTYSAKFSGRGGGLMNAVTRGGTNQFHGSLFEFVRNSKLNGRNYFSATQDGLKRNQFGGTIGGPIRKDKTFAFFSYQRTTIRQNPINSAIVLTATSGTATSVPIPSSWSIRPPGSPLTSNQVSPTLFDPVAEKLLALLPVGAPGTGLAYYDSRLEENDNQFVARVDEAVNQNLRIYGSYIYDALQEPSTSIPTNLLTAGVQSELAESVWRRQCDLPLQSESDHHRGRLLKPPFESFHLTPGISGMDRPGSKHSDHGHPRPDQSFPHGE